MGFFVYFHCTLKQWSSTREFSSVLKLKKFKNIFLETLKIKNLKEYNQSDLIN